jgi:hypothetical protein
MAILNCILTRRLPKNRRTVPTPSTRGMGQRGILIALAACLFLWGAWNAAQTPLTAQEEEETAVSREQRIKAAYLFQFGRYVEWPAKAFPDAKAPFVIGVLDGDPIVADLNQIAQTKKIQDRTIQIRRFSSVANIKPCHILFLPDTVKLEDQKEVLRRLSGTGTLTVGDSSGFLGMGGVVRFFMEENNIRVQIARKAAEREGLTISSKLLQVARVLD